MIIVKLKACPHCGCADVRRILEIDEIECAQCGAYTWGATLAQAEERWNARVESPESVHLKTENDALRAELSDASRHMNWCARQFADLNFSDAHGILVETRAQVAKARAVLDRFKIEELKT